MAEVIGAASAITTFVTLALESSRALYQTVRSLQSRDKIIRELRSEIQDLLGVLQTLEESIGNLNVDLATLEQPLGRCSNACAEFNTLIKGCTQNSTEERGSKRDWFKLRYMGEDISGFKNMLAGYKSTITIALAYANLRTTNATNSVLEEYKELIENTKCDLESHLHDIRTRLQSASQSSVTLGIDTAELRRMEEEKDSTQKGLDICEQFLTLIDQSRSTLLGDSGLAPNHFDQTPSSVAPNLSWLINAEGLNSTHKEITSWKLQLLQNLLGVGKNIQGPQPYYLPRSSNEQTPRQQTFQEDFSGTEALLEFCKRAEEDAKQPRTHYFEDVSTGDNSRQAIVTTLEDLISAKRIKSGDGSYQALGQMSNESVQTVFHRGGPRQPRHSERARSLETI